MILNKDIFDKQVMHFQENFEAKYNSTRIGLIYSELNYLTAKEFQETLILLLKRYNSNCLPSVEQVKAAAFSIAPAAIKLSRKEIELRVV